MTVRKFSTAILITVCVLSFAVSTVLAASGCGSCDTAKADVCNDGAWKKLGRGMCNMITFPFELPNQISRTNITDGPMAGWTYGLVKGIGMTVFRAGVGVYEVLSFPVPCPEGYKPILTEPEFFFENQNW